MKRSTKIAVVGTFSIITFAFAGALFAVLGLDFGATEMAGGTVAGILGGLRLVS